MAKERLFIGLNCGPAADGIDAAIAALAGAGEQAVVRPLNHLVHPLDQPLRNLIRTLLAGGTAFLGCESKPQAGKPVPPQQTSTDTATFIAQVDLELALAFAQAAREVIAQAKVNPAGIVAVGSSGLTISLLADSSGQGSAVEIASPAVIANALAKPVAAGFGGACLASGKTIRPWAWFDWLHFRDQRLARAVVHLGGLANVTFVPADAAFGDVMSFDVGPCGLLLDGLAARGTGLKPVPHTGKDFDADGAIASRGAANAVMLHELIAHPFFEAPAPKLANPAEFGRFYLDRFMLIAARHRIDDQPAHLLATATELVARLVAAAIAGLTERPHEVILSGGAAGNIHLAERIRTLLSPSSTVTTQKFGLDTRAHHAVAYAALAAARIDEEPHIFASAALHGG